MRIKNSNNCGLNLLSFLINDASDSMVTSTMCIINFLIISYHIISNDIHKHNKDESIGTELNHITDFPIHGLLVIMNKQQFVTP